MGKWWAKARRSGRTTSGDDLGRGDAAPEVGSIDLDHGWTPEPEAEEVSAEELAARFRARAARAEAERDLIRLRQRHWSGERVIEEGRRELEWWEHPEADPYAVLGLIPGVTIEEVSQARRKVAQQCHPDRLGPDADHDDAVRRMVAANSAYDRIRRALHPV